MSACASSGRGAWLAHTSVASCSYQVMHSARTCSPLVFSTSPSSSSSSRAAKGPQRYHTSPSSPPATPDCRPLPQPNGRIPSQRQGKSTISSESASSSSSPFQQQARERLAALDASAPASPFLRDRFNRQHTYLRISLTERCNLRCLYCMPLEGVPLTPSNDLLTAKEVERVARLFVQQGVNKIRLTGGEPTIRKDLPDVIDSLAALRPLGLKQIGITTNGLTIPRHIHHLVASGLTHLNVSLDTLDPFKFELMTRRPAKGIEKVLAGIETALALGVPQVKINVVVVRGLNDGKDILDFVEWAKDRNVIVRFIEYMPFDGNRWRPEKLVPYTDLLQNITRAFGPLEKVQDDANDTSKHWRVPGHKGSIGFVTSMTDHFCGTCNRLRVTADGNLKVCLFGNAEVSLRDAIRGSTQDNGPATDEDLLKIVGAAVKRKHARHAGMADPVELAKGLPHVSATAMKKEFFQCRTSLMHTRTRRQATSLRGALLMSPLARCYSSDRQDPWADLDAAADSYTESSQPGEKSNGTNEISDRAEFQSSDCRTRTQSWSAYMGTAAEGDESPWASLDAFADSKAVPALVQRETTSRSPADASAKLDSRAGNTAPSGLAEWDAMAVAAAESYARSANNRESSRTMPFRHQQSPGQSSPVSTRLTHLDPMDSSRASMVNVSSKAPSKRTAEATCRIYVDDVTWRLLQSSSAVTPDTSLPSHARSKGPVLHTAQLAGIMGAKRTSELIPLCHGLNLSHVDLHFELVEAQKSEMDPEIEQSGNLARHYIAVACTASTMGPTGVEMEALTGASIASLTLWDMLKSVGGQTMRIEGLKVTKKTGGKSGDFVREE